MRLVLPFYKGGAIIYKGGDFFFYGGFFFWVFFLIFPELLIFDRFFEVQDPMQRWALFWPFFTRGGYGGGACWLAFLNEVLIGRCEGNTMSLHFLPGRN